MIVEFMGCTGAGKSTLATAVVCRLQARQRRFRLVSESEHSVLLTLGHALSAPFHLLTVLRDWPRYRRYARVTLKALAGGAPNAFRVATRTNAALRRLSRHARCARVAPGELRIVDDGALATAQLAFYGDRAPAPPLVEPFLALVPLADLIVWVDAPLEALADRARSRPDAPRELRGRPRDEIVARLAHVRRLYRALALAPRAKGRVIHAWNPDAGDAERHRLAARITDEIGRRLDACPV